MGQPNIQFDPKNGVDESGPFFGPFNGLRDQSAQDSQNYSIDHMDQYAAQQNQGKRSLTPPKCDQKCQNDHRSTSTHTAKTRDGISQGDNSPVTRSDTSSGYETTATWGRQTGQFQEGNYDVFDPAPISGSHTVYYQDALVPQSAVTNYGTDQNYGAGANPQAGMFGASNLANHGTSYSDTLTYTFPHYTVPPGLSQHF